MQESFPMTGGDGPHSYAKNSQKQKEGAEMAKAMLVESIVENLEIDKSFSGPFCIVDLGCSTGPNTFIAIDNIIEGIIQKYKTEGLSTLPGFQVFFNDHISNDFNILFANLPLNREYFAAGVPGSFHARLFPKSFINVVYSSFALQWLSRAPQQLGEIDSPLFNKGRIYYGNAPEEVGQAYFAQYSEDMESFLSVRANELVPGGLMALLVPGRPDGTLPSQRSLGPMFHHLESCLLEMADEGVISRDKIDSFNLPIFSPSPEEIRTLVKQNGEFSVARLDLLPETPIVPILNTGECRCGFQSMITKHFGSEINEGLFERYAKKIEGQSVIFSDAMCTGLFILLKRNR